MVRFDASGRSLITGITNFPTAPMANTIHLPNGGMLHPSIHRPTINFLRHLGDLDLDPDIQEELEERQDRFQESYRQLVNHYEDLVQHYHTFLRSRIPRILGANPDSVNSEGIVTGTILPGSSSIGDNNIGSQVSLHPSFNDAQPGPSSRITNPCPGPSRPSSSSSQGMAASSSQSSQLNQPSNHGTAASAGANANASSSSPTNFGSIEALAQNIMEMQNLCRYKTCL